MDGSCFATKLFIWDNAAWHCFVSFFYFQPVFVLLNTLFKVFRFYVQVHSHTSLYDRNKSDFRRCHLLLCLILFGLSTKDASSNLLKGILWDFFIFALQQIIVLNKYCTYNKLIPKISHVKTLQNLCKMRYKKTIRK